MTAVRKEFIVSCLLFITYGFLQFIPAAVFAQSLSGVAVNMELADSGATEGDIMIVSQSGIVRAKSAYDATLFGVVAGAPILSVQPKTDKTKAVLSSGVAKVKVAAVEEIKAGDFITSSTQEGIGVKATKSGYILGKAMEGYSDKSKVGLVGVNISVGYAQIGEDISPARSFVNVIAEGGNLSIIVRYSLAFLFSLITLAGVIYGFTRFMSSGVVALGRNPLAKNTILSGMVISGLVLAAIAASGVVIALVIINLKLTILGGK